MITSFSSGKIKLHFSAAVAIASVAFAVVAFAAVEYFATVKDTCYLLRMKTPLILVLPLMWILTKVCLLL